jgi:tripartite-type tricarboxylate transporter receptor subunit TctC
VESGFPGVVIKNWVGFFVPEKTPDAIADKLNATINEIVQEPDIQARFRTFMMQPQQSDRRSAQQEFKEDLARWAKMVKEAGLAER